MKVRELGSIPVLSFNEGFERETTSKINTHKQIDLYETQKEQKIQ